MILSFMSPAATNLLKILSSLGAVIYQNITDKKNRDSEAAVLY